MTTITTRAGKGNALTYEEADANFTNLKTDVESLQGNITAANAAIVTANTAMKSYVDAANSTQSTQINTTQSWVTGANAAIVTANTAMRAYVDANAATQAGEIATTQSWVTGANAAIVSANTAMKSYVDAQDSAITTAWTANAGAQANQIAGANAAIVTANTAMKNYVDGQITTTQSWVTGANAAIVTANTALKAYTDNQIVTANTAMKGYVDAQITTTQSWVTGANAAVVTANTALKSYVDTQDSAITTAWTANAGVQADAITALQSNAGAQANQITGANVNIARIDANLGSFQTYANATYLYSNSNVASYLPVYGGTVYALNITGVPGQNLTLEPDSGGDVHINADTLAIGDNNADATITTRGTGNLLLRTHNADTTEGNITLSHGANGNIKLWPNGTGVVESAKSVVVQGNVSATYFLGDGSKLTGITAGTAYGDSNVAAYLPTYSGSLAASSDILALYANAGAQSDSIAGANAAIVTANTALKGYVDAQDSAITSAWTANAAVQQGQIDAKANTASLATVATTGSYSDLTNLPTFYSNTNTAAYLAGAITVGNITSTGGFYWANGLSYSTSTASTAFSGDLSGNALTDSTRGRILANASPNQTVVQIGSYTQGVVVNTPPSYTGANLNSQNQTVSLATVGNVNFLTTYANATLRTTNGTTAYLGVTATSANGSMNPSDRVRGFAAALDINLNGKNWGALTSASNTLTPIVTNGQTQNIYGTGQVGQAVAIGAAINITPVNGSISAQYVTSNFPSIAYSTAGGGATASNISTARLYAGAITATSNLTVTNAIALHTFSGWVSSNVSLVTNAYTVLNEDSRSIIQTNGNLTVSGALATTGNLRVNGYISPTKRYANPSSGNVAVSSSSMQSYQQIALAGNVGITASNNGFDTIYDFKIEQDGTGGRTLTWYDATGSSNTQVYGFLNPIPNSATIARAIMSDGGLWTVNYANPTAPSNTAANWRLYPGIAGATVSISDAGGKIAYWDTTNSRWSYIFDNSAV